MSESSTQYLAEILYARIALWKQKCDAKDLEIEKLQKLVGELSGNIPRQEWPLLHNYDRRLLESSWQAYADDSG